MYESVAEAEGQGGVVDSGFDVIGSGFVEGTGFGVVACVFARVAEACV